MEQEELARCVEAARISMLRLALSILGRGADAEDAVSEAIVSALEHRTALRDPDKINPWLLSITARKCYKLLGQRGRVLLTGDVPDKPVFCEDETRQVFAAIRALPSAYGQVLTLYYFDGYPAGQIAGILGLNPAAVWMRLSRGRKMLRERLLAEGVEC